MYDTAASEPGLKPQTDSCLPYPTPPAAAVYLSIDPDNLPRSDNPTRAQQDMIYIEAYGNPKPTSLARTYLLLPGSSLSR